MLIQSKIGRNKMNLLRIARNDTTEKWNIASVIVKIFQIISSRPFPYLISMSLLEGLMKSCLLSITLAPTGERRSQRES